MPNADTVCTDGPSIEPLHIRISHRRAVLSDALQRFVDAASSFADIKAVYVYGSFARDEVGPRSDLDLIVVRETKLRGPARGEDLVEKALPGVSFDLRVITPHEFAEAVEGRSGFWRDAMRDARKVYAARS